MKTLPTVAASLRMLVGGGFLFLGIHKLSDPDFLFGGLMRRVEEIGAPFPLYEKFLHRLVEIHQEAFAYAVAAGEILVGVSFLLGALVSLGAVGGAFLVLNFALATTWGNLPMMAAHLGLVALLFALGRCCAGTKWGVDAWLVEHLNEALVLFPLRRAVPVSPVRYVGPQPPPAARSGRPDRPNAPRR